MCLESVVRYIYHLHLRCVDSCVDTSVTTHLSICVKKPILRCAEPRTLKPVQTHASLDVLRLTSVFVFQRVDPHRRVDVEPELPDPHPALPAPAAGAASGQQGLLQHDRVSDCASQSDVSMKLTICMFLTTLIICFKVCLSS